MRFKKWRTYTHRRMLDAAVVVLGQQSLKGGTLLHVRWVRKDGFDFGRTDTVEVKEKEYANWSEVCQSTMS